MNIQITETSKSKYAVHVQATCGNVSALVSVYEHGLWVVCQNAAHKIFPGPGRFFPSVPRALEGYKSAEMKALIAAAVKFAAYD